MRLGYFALGLGVGEAATRSDPLLLVLVVVVAAFGLGVGLALAFAVRKLLLFEPLKVAGFLGVGDGEGLLPASTMARPPSVASTARPRIRYSNFFMGA